ncbi:MAG: UDP-glucose/GDP-mannose dehydrogenase family protein [Acidimicrobiaceae bacterium]|nr:UDP-glucose/GDP-mannose dehydrogenase family protein [Acidimicrobiaceae bacterium]
MADSRPSARNLAVVGAGYVGLTTAACLSWMGHRVVCSDIDEQRIDGLQRGEVPILEPRLGELLSAGLGSKRLRFVTDSAAAASGADFVFLCVPTPGNSAGGADMSFLEAAVGAVRDSLRPGAVLVNKSTAPPGSAAALARMLQRGDVAVASNPEFLRQGSAVEDFLEPDRVVVGADERAAARRVAELYASVDAPVLITDAASAESIKYAANAFLAVKLTYANSVAALCEAVGADVDDVLAGMGLDGRIGANYLQPGPGWGGSCLPKDTLALIGASAEAGYDFALLRSVVAANEAQLERIVGKVAGRVALQGARIALLGLAFKAGTDDSRDSPAMEIARRLSRAGAEVSAYDPAISGSPATREAGIAIAADAYQACHGANALVLATQWPEFEKLDFDRVARLMADLHVIDARNCLDREALEQRGFSYSGVGR